MIYAIGILAIMFFIGFDVGEALAVCAIIAAAAEILQKKRS